jgi:putative ABC transport system substrate-binding protein
MVVGALAIAYFYSAPPSSTKAKSVTIGILVPMQFQAMDEIVAGFQEELNKTFQGKITYLVKNAQGDSNVQRSILQQFVAQNVDMVASIGTSSSQMAMTIIKNKPLIVIAALISNKDIQASNTQTTGVLDDISLEKQLQFIHQALPQISSLSLIHSMSDPKIFQDVKEVKAAAAKVGIQLQDLGLSQLSELYSVSQQIVYLSI